MQVAERQHRHWHRHRRSHRHRQRKRIDASSSHSWREKSHLSPLIHLLTVTRRSEFHANTASSQVKVERARSKSQKDCLLPMAKVTAGYDSATEGQNMEVIFTEQQLTQPHVHKAFCSSSCLAIWPGLFDTRCRAMLKVDCECWQTRESSATMK